MWSAIACAAAAEMAAAQRIRSTDLHRSGVVDHIVPESPDAAAEPVACCRRVGAVLSWTLDELVQLDDAERRVARAHRFDRLGVAAPALAQAG